MRKKILAPVIALSLATMLTACTDNDADNTDENGTEDVEQNEVEDTDEADDNDGTDDAEDNDGTNDADDTDGTDDTSYYDGSDPINQVEYEQGVSNDEMNANQNAQYYGYDGSTDGTFPGTDNANQDVDWENAQPMNETDQQQSQVFADVAAGVDNVEAAQCYVMGNYALVAIEVKSGVDDQEVITNVKDALQKETEGMNFYIISDYGSFDQMQQSVQSMTGQPDKT